MFLPQLNVPGLVDFPWEPLPVWRSGWRVDWGEGGECGRRGEELSMECKMKFKKSSKIKKFKKSKTS